ncbi:MAG: hypothetical protein IT227_09955 [Flavobacteriales bacterium]|nr:hypothetical protein [Flavobacteriales bacterium]
MIARYPFSLLLCATTLVGICQDNYSGFTYQAVVRGANGDPLAGQNVGVRVRIQPGLSPGYTERHLVTTDAHGQIKLVMGEGTPEANSVIPTFADINWTNGDLMSYSISVDITGGMNYVFLGGGQFKSVPFALRSLYGGAASGWTLNGNDLHNTNSGNVGINTAAPVAKLHVNGSSLLSGGHSYFNQSFNETAGNAGFGGTPTANVKLLLESDLQFALYAQNYSSSPSSYAGYFVGNAAVSGTLSKGGGAFKIDHPLDPANKFLYHSFVESPDMMNVYNGNVVLDADGRAIVVLPDYFEALNKDHRYQLTAIGAPGPGLHIARKVENGTFVIAGGTPGGEVSWQVTGVRKDAFANENRIPNVVEKKGVEVGRYLHPTAFGLDRSLGIDERIAIPE